MTDQKTATEAFIAAQAEMKNASLNRTNPHFKSRYADLPAVREATLPALTKHGLAIIQTTAIDEAGFRLCSRLIYRDGSVVAESTYPLSTGGKPQQIGSEITYARRYTWAALCGIAADEDDDANAAQNAPRKAVGNSGMPSADDPTWTGPLNKTKLKEASREIASEVRAIDDLGALHGYLSDGKVKAVIEQLGQDMPEWWQGNQEHSGLAGIITERKTALSQNDTFPGDLP